MSEAATGGIPEKLAALGPNHTTAEAFHAIDTDQSGQISLAEFAPVYEHGREQARAQERTTNKALAENKLLKWMVVLLILAVLIIIGITSGVSALPTLPLGRVPCFPPCIRPSAHSQPLSS